MNSSAGEAEIAGSLPSQWSQIGESQVKMQDPVSKSKEDSVLRNKTSGWPRHPVYMYTHWNTHAHPHMHVYTLTQRAQNVFYNKLSGTIAWN